MVATNLNTLNSLSIRLAQNLWFSVKALKCKAQQDDLQAASHSVTALSQEIIECIQKKIKDESESKKKRPKTSKKEPAGKAKRIKLIPFQKQKETLIKWFGATRAKCVNNKNFQNENKWVLETPYDIRDEGMNDLLKAYKTNFAAHKKEFKIKLGEFFLCLPMSLEIRSENQAPQWTSIEERILSLDPGVRTFSTGYSPSGLPVEWGKNDIGRIYCICHALDKTKQVVTKRSSA
ncbi:hypothetical protein C2G38_2156713 [Gigaspora rosea]|uniref:Uncharacterized protein n=1 Tax=Gigaspora rosea TaxID=44941 RepID=A0A397W937_9GLOM|nr:hypothetical protein C2G38_2156713 [Gigaspora rosea]